MDAAGNQTLKDIGEIQLVRSMEQLAFSCSTTEFSPTGTLGSKTALFQAQLSTTNNLSDAELHIYDQSSGKEIRTIKDIGALNTTITWNGKNDDGSLADDGNYRAEAVYYFNSGHTVTGSISNIIMDRNPPDYRMNISPTLFTPDGSGENDLLHVNLVLTDFTGVSNWSINIFKKNEDGGKGPLFKSYFGNGNTSTMLTWDGTGNDKNDFVESVQDYILELNAEDAFGNSTGNVDRTISVGVLVDKLPTGLRIRVSSIRFAFDKADPVGDSKETLDKVIYIIRKILSDPAKYDLTPDYKIVISGHTDDIPGPTADYNQKLSERRAKTV